MNLGKNIKKFRKQKGFTQVSMAKYLKTKQSTFSRMEAGEQKVLAIDLWKIAKKFKVPMDRFFK